MSATETASISLRRTTAEPPPREYERHSSAGKQGKRRRLRDQNREAKGVDRTAAGINDTPGSDRISKTRDVSDSGALQIQKTGGLETQLN